MNWLNISRSIGFAATLLWCWLLITPANAAEVRDIVFPVIGSVNYSDDFGAPRSGHTHEGNDIFGNKGLTLVAAVDGTVRYVAWPERSYGYYISITDDDGYKYNYLHINNDTPGTDDGLGGGVEAYAPYIEQSYPVKAGQLIGWLGDSGNAENTAAHLHFEIRQPDNTAISPYDSLQAADYITAPVEPDILDGELLPYGLFGGGAQVALGNLDSDSSIELVTGASNGGGPQVRVFTRTGYPIKNFYAYDQSFHGGVRVAVHSGTIVTAPWSSGGPDIRQFTIKGVYLDDIDVFERWWSGGYDVAFFEDVVIVSSAQGPRRTAVWRFN